MLIWDDREGNCFYWQGWTRQITLKYLAKFALARRVVPRTKSEDVRRVDYVQATFALRQHLATQCARWVSLPPSLVELRRTSRSTHPACFTLVILRCAIAHRRRAKHEPGIHSAAEYAGPWILRCAIAHHSSRKKARPGMTEGATLAATQSRTTRLPPEKPLALLHR